MTVTVTALIRLSPQCQPSTPNMQPSRLNNQINGQPTWTAGRPNHPQSRPYCLSNQYPATCGVLPYTRSILEVWPFKPIAYYRLNALLKVAYFFPAIIHKCSLNTDFHSKQFGDVLMQKNNNKIDWYFLTGWCFQPLTSYWSIHFYQWSTVSLWKVVFLF